jgi:hypothetical protein
MVVVSPLVVMVAEALAGGVTVAGLMVQTGGSVGDRFDAVTWQVRSTVPVNPGSVVTEMLMDEVPPGATASGESGEAVRAKFWAATWEGQASRAGKRHRAAMAARRVRRVKTGFDNSAGDDSDFNMSRSGFK